MKLLQKGRFIQRSAGSAKIKENSRQELKETGNLFVEIVGFGNGSKKRFASFMWAVQAQNNEGAKIYIPRKKKIPQGIPLLP